MCRRRSGHREAETSNQASEALVVRQRFTDELLGTTTAAIVDELLEKDWAKPLSLDVGSYDDREFGSSVVRIRDCTRYSQGLDTPAFARAGSNERHFSIVVDLRQTRELRAWQLTYLHKDSIADIVRVERVKELEMLRTVFRSDRSQQHWAVLPIDPLLELLRIGADRESIDACCARGCDTHARIEHKDPLVVGQEWVDVEFDDLRNVGDQVRHLNQGLANPGDVCWQPIAVPGEQLGNARARNELARQYHVERRQADGAVGGDFHGRAACADEDDRAEDSIRCHADDEFV